jgi:hypothetical protein
MNLLVVEESWSRDIRLLLEHAIMRHDISSQYFTTASVMKSHQ